MSKKQSNFPVTKSCKPMPPHGTEDWIIWAAWADRITFEEIYKITGKKESDVIRIMRKNLKPSSFRKWRARASQVSHKHRKKFQALRLDLEIN